MSERTLESLCKEIQDLISKGHGKKLVYILDTIYTEENIAESHYRPFTYRLGTPTELDEAILGIKVDTKSHIMFNEEAAGKNFET